MKTQQWWRDGKFGLFIHWGLFSELAGEYNGTETKNIAEWIMHDLHIPISEYEKLADTFTAEKFDADRIVKMARDTGMKYICFTTKHHEGFAMYDSKVSDYTIVKRTPYAHDPLRDLRNACDKYGLKFGIYYSQAQDWHDPNGCEDGDDGSTKDFEVYFRNKCLPQVIELMENYGPVDLIWFDTPMYMTKAQSTELRDTVKRINPDCIISGRIGNELGDYLTTGDNFIPLLPVDYDFEVPATTNHSWGYNRFDDDWEPASTIIRKLVKIVSRGGNYLLNVGPKADGEVPPEAVAILGQIGDFMKKNGDSIYGTQKMPVYPYDIDWGCFTYKPGRLYIHVFDSRKSVYLLNIHNKPLKAYMLSDGKELEVIERVTCEGDSSWNIWLPESDRNEIDRVICVEVEGDQIEFEPIHL